MHLNNSGLFHTPTSMAGPNHPESANVPLDTLRSALCVHGCVASGYDYAESSGARWYWMSVIGGGWSLTYFGGDQRGDVLAGYGMVSVIRYHSSLNSLTGISGVNGRPEEALTSNCSVYSVVPYTASD